MTKTPDIDGLHEDMIAWRRDIHANPEIAFEEHRTADLVASNLEAFGVEVVRGLAGTGVVGVLKGNRDGERAIGLRADMDALPMEEKTNVPYRSQVPGKMHACGHDGHVAMLLGAAKHLAATRNFAGTAYFIFQPAEEGAAGGKVMVDEGLFERFPMEGVYGMHNWPGLPVGEIVANPGPTMAASDVFQITISGSGAHAAMPHQGNDTIVTGSAIVTALQTITSRTTNPLDALVVSVTQFHGGDAFNVLPDQVTLCGTARSFQPDVRDSVEPAMRRIIDGICSAHGTSAELRYERRYPATVNSKAEAEHSGNVAAKIVGDDKVHRSFEPSMGAEDFAYMLEKTPGSYIRIGAGEDSANLHSPHYNFNDDILPLGARYWTTLVEETLNGEPVGKG